MLIQQNLRELLVEFHSQLAAVEINEEVIMKQEYSYNSSFLAERYLSTPLFSEILNE